MTSPLPDYRIQLTRGYVNGISLFAFEKEKEVESAGKSRQRVTGESPYEITGNYWDSIPISVGCSACGYPRELPSTPGRSFVAGIAAGGLKARPLSSVFQKHGLPSNYALYCEYTPDKLAWLGGTTNHENQQVTPRICVS